MFTHPQIPEPDLRPRFSQAAPVRPQKRQGVRILKCSLASLLLILGSAAILASSRYVISDNAVVTAYVVSLRAPLEGVVAARAGGVGYQMRAGAPLTEIVNSLVDERQVTLLEGRLAKLRAHRDALEQQRTVLTGIQNDLGERVARHRTAKVAELEIAADRARRDRLAKSAELEQLVRDMRRAVAPEGAVSRAEIERTESAVRVMAQQVQSLEQQVASAVAQTRYAEAGVMIEGNSGADVAYSEQRVDEVRIRMAELDRLIAEVDAETAEAQWQLTAEEGRNANLKQASVVAPSEGMIWRVGAAQGERVGPGSLLAQLVDCGTAFLAVAVPQDRLPDVELGSTASFRLSGERMDREGVVVAVTGDPTSRDNPALAAAPAFSVRPVGSVLISLPPSPNTAGACLVGRTARVRLPIVGGTWLAQMRRSAERAASWLVPW